MNKSFLPMLHSTIESKVWRLLLKSSIAMYSPTDRYEKFLMMYLAFGHSAMIIRMYLH